MDLTRSGAIGESIGMRHPSPLPHSLATVPFAVEDARELGVTKSRLRGPDLASPYYGVRSPDLPLTMLDRARAYATKMMPDQYFSHTTAAQLLGLRMPTNFAETVVHVTSIAELRAPRGAGVVGHGARDAPQILILPGGLRVTAPLDTWCDLRASLGHRDLIVMGDGLVRRLNPLVTLGELLAAVDAVRGTRGARILREAAAFVRCNTDSAPETDLRMIAVEAGFPEPEVNGLILNQYGAEIAHGDLVFRPYRTILEYDGGQHRTDDRQFHIDVSRLDDLMEERWRVIRVDKYLLARRATLLGKIDRALREGGWRR